MRRRFRVVAAGLLVCLAAVLVVGIVALYDWGGSMEVMLNVFGDHVWVNLDSTSPRLWFLLVVPGVFLAAARSLGARRPGE